MAENTEYDTSSLQESSAPHDAMFFVLSYLPLLEMLTITRVCKSFKDAINKDILPWLEIIVNRPLSRRITDDTLMEVASRANGRLRVLSLIDCSKITDEGVLRVIAQNPEISKLHLPGCTSLTPVGVIESVKYLTKNKNHKLSSLQINGIYGIQKEDLKTLKNLISLNEKNQCKILYHKYKKHKETNDCSIDVDICPRCDEVRMVFDCTQLVCYKKQKDSCRGCDLCILRCIECGICITDTDQELEDLCCEDSVCSDCWLKLSKCIFCNKPYCGIHADKKHTVSGSSGFVCASCHSKFVL